MLHPVNTHCDCGIEAEPRFVFVAENTAGDEEFFDHTVELLMVHLNPCFDFSNIAPIRCIECAHNTTMPCVSAVSNALLARLEQFV